MKFRQALSHIPAASSMVAAVSYIKGEGEPCGDAIEYVANVLCAYRKEATIDPSIGIRHELRVCVAQFGLTEEEEAALTWAFHRAGYSTTYEKNDQPRIRQFTLRW